MIEWLQWQHATSQHFTLRGQYTRARGKPVLHFIHGNSYSGLTYLPLWEALYPHFDIFLHDVQGHGDSDQGAAFVGWNESADLALTAAEYWLPKIYGTAPVYGCGHSFGGILTLLMTHQRPQLFNELALLDPILFLPSMILPMRVLSGLGLYSLNPYAKRARRRRCTWPNREAALAGLRERGMFRGWQPAALEAYVDYAMCVQDECDQQGAWGLKCSPQREAEIFSSYARGLWPAITQQLHTPTHVWGGQQSYPFLHQSLRKWQRSNPKVRLDWLPGGHCFMLQNPELVAAQIRQRLLGVCE